MAEYERDQVVVPQVDEIAVYWNKFADVVIRQKHPMGDEDAVVVLPFGHIKALVKRLNEMAKNRPEPDSGD